MSDLLALVSSSLRRALPSPGEHHWRVPERLTGLDSLFLYAETPSMPMQVAVTAILDPSTVPGGYTFETVSYTHLTLPTIYSV